MTFSRKLFFFALTATLLAVIWQQINLHYLFPNGTVQPVSGMIETADDASYLSPPKNFIVNGVWADNSVGLSRYYQRPPGYGMIFGVFYFFLGNDAFIALKVLQIICFFLSVFLLGKILRLINMTQKLTLVFTGIFALLPIYSGFIYFSITEGITPFLVIFAIYSNLSANKTQTFVSLALILLVRPQLLFIPSLFLMLSLIRKEYKMSAIILISGIPFMFWMFRNTMIAGEFPGIHPIYSDTNQSLYRPGHRALTDLFRIWEHDGEHFHSIIHGICAAQNNEEVAQIALEVPDPFRSRVAPVLEAFNVLYQRKDYGRSIAFKQLESKFVYTVDAIRNDLRKEFKFDFYVKTPVNSAVYLLSKSQLNLFVFQETFRGSLLMELIRYLSVLIINLGAVSCVYVLFIRNHFSLRWIAAGVLTYFCYLFFFQRMNEERYLTPLLPVLLILLAVSTSNFLDFLRSRKDNQRSRDPLPLL
ncbi:MAG: hypothetical protein ACK45H_08605 [Bacteroidota bacterium]